MKLVKFILIGIIGIMLVMCNFTELEYEVPETYDRLIIDPARADGLLLRGYLNLPYNHSNPYRWDDVATDDAVHNQPGNTYRQMATGSLSSLSNPQNAWDYYQGIMYINQFLEIVDNVVFVAANPVRNELYQRRMKGEAYALRGAIKYFLLRNHGGEGTNGELLGIPIYDEYEVNISYFNKPRESFNTCVQSAYEDLDRAIALLPFEYANVSNTSALPSNYRDVSNIEDYNVCCGNVLRQRISGHIAIAFKARLALLHASPAFNPGNDPALWEKAAEYAGTLLDQYGGPNNLDPTGHLFYLGSQVEKSDLGTNSEQGEVLWRKPRTSESVKEADNFPPSLGGRGNINPTQEFVDAFPASDGWPIAESTIYNADMPYENRDPRLKEFVIVNGENYKNSTIYTGISNPNNSDGVGLSTNATRTGYYLKKLLRSDVTLTPGVQAQIHVDPYIRYTEIFLIYAEAANEAWGPDGGQRNYNARDIIEAIRKRGMGLSIDPYLSSITNKDSFRALIQNERRIELCFEGFRYWDLRRWKKSLNMAVTGIEITGDAEPYEYNRVDVEQRAYQDYMIYGPIPNSEVVKYNYIQNKGW